MSRLQSHPGKTSEESVVQGARVLVSGYPRVGMSSNLAGDNLDLHAQSSFTYPRNQSSFRQNVAN